VSDRLIHRGPCGDEGYPGGWMEASCLDRGLTCVWPINVLCNCPMAHTYNEQPRDMFSHRALVHHRKEKRYVNVPDGPDWVGEFGVPLSLPRRHLTDSYTVNCMVPRSID